MYWDQEDWQLLMTWVYIGSVSDNMTPTHQDTTNCLSTSIWQHLCDQNVVLSLLVNSLTPKSIPAGTKLVLFGRYVLNIYIGIVQYFLCTTKLSAPKST
jgi:hypothetical protein